MPPKKKQDNKPADPEKVDSKKTTKAAKSESTPQNDAPAETSDARPRRNRSVVTYNETKMSKPKSAREGKKSKGKKSAAGNEDQDQPKGAAASAAAIDDTKGNKTSDPKTRKRVAEVSKVEDNGNNDEDGSGTKSVKNRKKAVEKPSAVLKNQTSTAYQNIDFQECARKNEDGKKYNFKISSFNVDGVRAWIKKGGIDFLTYENADVYCIQEMKCSEDKLPSELTSLDGYHGYYSCSKKDGYAGVALLSKTEPITVSYNLGDEDYEDDGRVITAEFNDFYVISVYVPNAGKKLISLPNRLNWNGMFRKYIAELDKIKPVIICGDMNVAHLTIDLANPKANMRNAGFTQEERDGMTEFLSDGYIDTFRKLYPEKAQAYTFWTYLSNSRARNIGWRLDYFIVSERIMNTICDNVIRSEVFGSDHCPITLFLTI